MIDRLSELLKQMADEHGDSSYVAGITAEVGRIAREYTEQRTKLLRAQAERDDAQDRMSIKDHELKELQRKYKQLKEEHEAILASYDVMNNTINSVIISKNKKHK